MPLRLPLNLQRPLLRGGQSNVPAPADAAGASVDPTIDSNPQLNPQWKWISSQFWSESERPAHASAPPPFVQHARLDEQPLGEPPVEAHPAALSPVRGSIGMQGTWNWMTSLLPSSEAHRREEEEKRLEELRKKRRRHRIAKRIILAVIFLMLCCFAVAIYLWWEQRKLEKRCGHVGPEVWEQPETIQIVNCGTQTLWIAYQATPPASVAKHGYKGGWPRYPKEYRKKKGASPDTRDLATTGGEVEGSIRVDPGGWVYFPTDHLGARSGRIWPMLGCNKHGKACKVGCSVGSPGGGLVASGYGKDGLEYTVPIDSKFEFTLAKDHDWNPLWPLDSLDVSAVDGLTLPFLFAAYTHKTQENYEVKCSMPPGDCPTSDPLHTDCDKWTCPTAGESTDASMMYTNTHKEYLGCQSPCAYLVKGGFNSAPKYKGLDNSFPGASYYCCPSDACCCQGIQGPGAKCNTEGCPANDSCLWIDSKVCNAGPAPHSKWCDAVHRNCLITKSSQNNTIGKPGIYCQAYDDALGLKNLAAGPNRYKMSFWDKGFACYNTGGVCV